MLTTEEIRRLLDIAITGMHKGEVALARTIFSGILADNPNHVPTLIAQALSHTVVGEYDIAEDILRTKVLAGHPSDADALAYLGLTLTLAERKDEAKEVLGKVPTDTQAGNLAQELLNKLRQ